MSGHVHFRPHFVDGKIAIEHIQDCTPILDANAEDRRDEQDHDCARKIATIPCVILVKWLDEEANRGNRGLRLFTAEFDEIIARKLKDPEWAYLRTDRPKLQVGW